MGSLLLRCLLVTCLVGSQSGCVTAYVMERIFSTEDAIDLDLEDSRPPTTGWLLKRIGLATLVLPFTLSGDLVVAVSFGWLLYDDDEDEEDCRAPPPRVRTTGGASAGS